MASYEWKVDRLPPGTSLDEERFSIHSLHECPLQKFEVFSTSASFGTARCPIFQLNQFSSKILADVTGLSGRISIYGSIVPQLSLSKLSSRYPAHNPPSRDTVQDRYDVSQLISNMVDVVEVLKSRPSLEKLERALKERVPSDPASQLAFVLALLDHTVPEIYSSLPDALKSLVVLSLLSIVGIGNLVGKVRNTADAPTELPQSRADLTQRYIDLLAQVCYEGLVVDLVMASTPLMIKELNKLLYKGQMYSIVNETIALNLSLTARGVFSSMETYIAYICLEVLALIKYDEKLTTRHFDHTARMFISSLLSIHGDVSVTTFFGLMFCVENWHHYVAVVKRSRTYEQRDHFTKLLLHYIEPLYLQAHLKPPEMTLRVVMLASILCSLDNVSDLVDEHLIERVVARQNSSLNALMSLVLRSGGPRVLLTHVNSVLVKFSDPSLIKSESISRQISRANLLLCLVSKVSVAELERLLHERAFLDAVSNRLGSFLNNVKALGVILADAVCQYSGQPKIFKMPDGGLEGNYNDWIGDEAVCLGNTLAIPQADVAWTLLDVSNEVEDSVEEVFPHTHETPASQVAERLKQHQIDSDDELDDDDPTVARKQHVVAPLYVKDLLTYLTVDVVKDSAAYEKRRLVLTTTPILLRQKASFGNEVSFFAEDLYVELVALTNHFEEDDFDTLRLNAMIAVLASFPYAAKRAVQLLGTGDYSLQQRMCILSSLSLAARDIKGLHDEVVVASYRGKLQTKQLPEALHHKFASQTEQPIATGIEHLIQNDLIDKVSESFPSSGQILRISKKLTTANSKQPQPLVTQSPFNIAKLVAPQFFYPLVSVWHGIGGEISIGHYSTILTAHYIQTFTILLHCAYPVAVELNDMIREYILILTPLTIQVTLEQIQLIESVVTALLLICDISDEELLTKTHYNELTILLNWLTQIWEGIIDDRVKSLSAGLLLRLNQILERNGRLVLDQMNGMY